MTLSYVWPASLSRWFPVCRCVGVRNKLLWETNSFKCRFTVIWLVCHMIHVWHDSFMTHAYAWHYSHVCLDWQFLMCDMAHISPTSWEPNAAAIHVRIHNDMAHRLNVTWLTALSRSCIWHDLFICVTWFVYMCDTESFTCVKWLIHMAYPYVQHASLTKNNNSQSNTATLHVPLDSDITGVWHDSSIHVIWLIDMCGSSLSICGLSMCA